MYCMAVLQYEPEAGRLEGHQAMPELGFLQLLGLCSGR